MVIEMLESVSDLVSLIVMIAFTVAGFIAVYTVSPLHHKMVKKRRRVHYDFYDDLNDDAEDDGQETAAGH